MRFTLLLIPMLAGAVDLGQRLDPLVDAGAPPGRGAIGIHVIDLTTGKTLYHRNDDRLMLPASNMKLFTSALALMRLGADHRFVTQVFQEPSGDLILSGGGDPSLCGRVFPYKKDAVSRPPLQAIEELADQVVANGVHTVAGDIVGDDRLYPWSPYAPSWTQDDLVRDYGAPVSALSVAENSIAITVQAGVRPGDPAEISIEPHLEYYAIDNRVVTVGRSPEAKVRISREMGSRQVLVWGSIPAGHLPVRETIAIDDPALYAACAFYDALTRRGVAIAGHPVAQHRPASDDYLPPQGNVVAMRSSPPLLDLLQVMDKVSQNLFAELMLRETGRAVRHMGTREAGLEELDAMLGEIGATKDESRMEDGSGLSRNALVTPHAVTRLLWYMHRSKFRDEFAAMLPGGGVDGTLQHRFCCADAPLIQAKTGSLSRAVALSGYADSKTFGRVAFSILVNDFSAPSGAVRQWVDKIAIALLE